MNNEVKTINGYSIKDETARNSISSLDTQINTSNFYDLNYIKGRQYSTDYYIVIIPKNDIDNNPINVYTDIENITPLEYAQKHHTTLTINAGLTYQNASDEWKQGIVISNGEIINPAPSDITYRDDNVYIGFTEDRRILEFQANSITAQEMLNQGVKNAYLVFYRYMNNGELEEHTDVPNWTVESPRMDIGITANGDIVILACDGRTENNIGLTNEQALTIMQEYNCIRAWRGDGGGSTSLNLKGAKINRNIDDNGTTDRKITCTLNIKKTIVNEELADVYNKIGQEKQLLNKQLRNDLNRRINDIQYQEGKCYLRINDNSRNNLSGTTYENIILDGRYRHGEEITVCKDENNNIIGFTLNKSGMFRVVVVGTFESQSAGQKTIKITKGDTDETEWLTTISVEETGTGVYRQIVCDTVVNHNNETPMPIKLWKKGQVGDRWLRITAYCEDLGSAE